MSITESSSSSNFNNNQPNNPPPTGKQVKQRMKSRVSQRETILATLKRDGQISSEQMRNMGYYSGAKRISELKEAGHIIEKTQDWNKNGLATYWYKGHKGDANG